MYHWNLITKKWESYKKKDPHYAKLLENMKLKMKEIKEITVSIPMEHYARK